MFSLQRLNLSDSETKLRECALLYSKINLSLYRKIYEYLSVEQSYVSKRCLLKRLFQFFISLEKLKIVAQTFSSRLIFNSLLGPERTQRISSWKKRRDDQADESVWLLHTVRQVYRRFLLNSKRIYFTCIKLKHIANNISENQQKLFNAHFK